MNSSGREYWRRLNRVLDYIDHNLAKPIDLQELAAVAHFSPYHFHRIFAESLGETLGDYVQRRRLALAAELLAARPDMSVLRVALTVGFGSGEAFARAFKRQFCLTPKAWRAQTPQRWAEQLEAARTRLRHPRSSLSNLDQEFRFDSGDDAVTEHIFPGPGMKIQILDLPATPIAYLRKIGPYGESVAEFWCEQFIPWLETHGLANASRFGIPYDDCNVTTASKCRFDAAVGVESGFVASGKASTGTLPGGRYAVTPFIAKPSTIGAAWTALFRGWLPGSGMQCDARPIFAHYPPGSQIDPITGEFACELCIPVRPL